MKNLFVSLLFIFNFTFFNAQVNYQPVLDLLIANKRQDARKLFDKNFSKTKDSNIELLLLDLLLEVEMGKTMFDETFIKKIEKFSESKHYVAALMNEKFIFGDVNDESYDDLTFVKGDFLAQSPLFSQILDVKYTSAILAQRRRDFEKYKSYMSQLNSINEWQRCGAFENLNGSGLNTEYEPETYAKNDKLFDANSNGKLGWYNPIKHENEGYTIFYNEDEYGSGVMYAQTFIDVPETKKYIFRFGASGGIKFFLNDEEIIVKEDIQRNNLDAFLYEFELPKGMNRLLVKLDASKSYNYFSAAFNQLDGKPAKDLRFYDKYQPYNQKQTVQINELELPFEVYFKNLVQSNPKNVLYRYLLFHAYMANQKKELAHDVIEDLEAEFTKSSFISTLVMNYYTVENDENKVQELVKNMEQDDPSYYFNAYLKIADRDWLTNASKSELDKFHDYTKDFLSPGASLLFDFIKASKDSNIDLMFSIYDNLIKSFNNPSKMVTTGAELYKQLKNDKDTYYAKLKAYDDKYFDFSVNSNLISHYKQLNQKDQVKALMQKNIDMSPNANYGRTDLIDEYIKDNNYESALQLIDENIAYFPYSFVNFEKKAEVLNLNKHKKGAEEYYKKALLHNASSTKLRTALYEILQLKDEIEEAETKDVYDLIKKRRNTKLIGDHGVTILFDEQIVNVYPEGGRKIKVTYVYEVTNESGIEYLKEYSLNTSGVNLTKYEIVKPNGSLSPAEDNGDMLVFTNLAVGDVIYVSYDYTDNSYGRFYKDFNISHQFNGNYANVESVFKLIYPQDMTFKTAFLNGEAPMKEKKMGQKILKEWRKENISNLPIYESYAPTYADLVNTFHIGTINNWKEIANWYADLVKKSMKYDKITEKTFNEIFPNGTNGLSDYQKAYEIYKYIGQNITYSFLDFRQSGHVPQKPSKTIITKLGDCKDLSTLFVVLGEKAGLNANLVLVLTNDNGSKQLLLPSQEFNHCIVSVNLDGKVHFLEMTNNFLPFLALPNSLYKASALQIYFDKAKNENANLIAIPFDNTMPNISVSKTRVNVTDSEKEFVTTFTLSGDNKSYFNELFSDRTSEEVRKTELESYLNNGLSNTVNLIKSELIKNERFSNEIVVELIYKIKEKTQKLGSLKMLNLPFVFKPFNKDIVTLESRKFEIEYSFYESSHKYESEITFNIPDGHKFVEIPENKTLSYKDKNYELTYELVAPNQLLVKRTAKMSWDNIPVNEYQEFKTYVDDILDLEQQVIGFK